MGTSVLALDRVDLAARGGQRRGGLTTAPVEHSGLFDWLVGSPHAGSRGLKGYCLARVSPALVSSVGFPQCSCACKDVPVAPDAVW